MKLLLHVIYIMVLCSLLCPFTAFAQEGEREGDLSTLLEAPLMRDSEPLLPRVEVRDGVITPLCEYDQMQVFNVMGQEVRNEHLPAGIYLVRLIVRGETYTLKVVIR